MTQPPEASNHLEKLIDSGRPQQPRQSKQRLHKVKDLSYGQAEQMLHGLATLDGCM